MHPNRLPQQEEYQESASKSKSISLPKSLFKGQFNLTEEAFQEGLEAGDFVAVVTKTGKTHYAWETNEHSEKMGKVRKFGHREEKVGTSNDRAAFDSAMKNWKLGLFQAFSSNPDAQSSKVTPKQLKAITDKNQPLSDEDWQKAEHQLNLAMPSFDKLVKDAKRHLQTIGHDQNDTVFQNLSLVCNDFFTCVSISCYFTVTMLASGNIW